MKKTFKNHFAALSIAIALVLPFIVPSIHPDFPSDTEIGVPNVSCCDSAPSPNNDTSTINPQP